MQCTLGILHFGRQQLHVVPNMLTGVGDKVGELSRWKHVILIEIKDMTRKKPDLKILTLKINEFHLQL